MRLLILTLMVFSFLLTGCSRDPLQLLKSESKDKALSYQFWSHEYEQNTPLWHHAVTYCVSNSDKPNCGYVLNIYMSGDGNEKPPKIGQSGHYIHMDYN